MYIHLFYHWKVSIHVARFSFSISKYVACNFNSLLLELCVNCKNLGCLFICLFIFVLFSFLLYFKLHSINFHFFLFYNFLINLSIRRKQNNDNFKTKSLLISGIAQFTFIMTTDNLPSKEMANKINSKVKTAIIFHKCMKTY